MLVGMSYSPVQPRTDRLYSCGIRGFGISLCGSLSRGVDLVVNHLCLGSASATSSQPASGSPYSLTLKGTSTELFWRIIKVEEVRRQRIGRRLVLVVMIWLQTRTNRVSIQCRDELRDESDLPRGTDEPTLPAPSSVYSVRS